MTEFIVYCHTNTVNGKKYIGITSQKPERRWRNGNGYPVGAFHRAIIKYGWNGFSHEILLSGLDEKTAKDEEKRLILQFQTNNKKCGYNITDGGDGTCGYARSDEEKNRMSASRKGRHAGEKNPMYGKVGKLSPMFGTHMKSESKAKLSNALILQHNSGAYKKLQVKVYAVKDGVTIFFNSIADAERSTGVPSTHITRNCKGKRNSAGGFVWSYC